MSEKEITLDDLVVSQGQEFNEEVSKKLEARLMYDEPTLMPTGNTTINTDEHIMDKDSAEKDMLSKLAEQKLEKERAAFEKMSDDEKIRDYVRQTQYYRNTNDFYHKYHYEMSGKQKRTLKREIESKLNKLVSKITPAQRDEILLELNKQYRDNSANAGNVMNNQKEKVTSLSALM